MDKSTKILIADDSQFMRKILRDILEEEGFKEFIECENGNECIAKFHSEKPDLVLLDIIMPEKNGVEVLQEIGGLVNVLVVSAVGQDSMIEEAKANGAKGYIVKPFENKKVIEEIEKVLR